MAINRRRFCQFSAATLLLPSALRAAPAPALTTLVSGNNNCNAIAVDSQQQIFLGFPRFGEPHQPSYSVARLTKEGKVVPFPDDEWNRYRPGQNARNAFVAVNAVHIFADDTLWVVDQGATSDETPVPGAQKVIQLDNRSGEVLKVLRFDEQVLPKGAAINDLRIHGTTMILTDSGAGGIVLHDLDSGDTLRRLHGQPSVQNDAQHPLRGSGGRLLKNAAGEKPTTYSNQLEIDPSGTWLYFAPLIGPMRKVRIRDLWDRNLSDSELNKRVSYPFDIASTNGTAMDDRGNFYICDAEHRQIDVVSPQGKRATLIKHPRLISPDALFIDRRRTLYIPCGQVEYTAGMNGGHYQPKLPFEVFTLRLPEQLAGIQLGSFLG
ncbi:L-dopachrome tautomerase-related protein [Carnimonas bestiolae]|uniref:L-dopachrome tautomerase-related protein n=1 Tax=Carnimonas bestiolae TaxID=3402172 RepID=UPI003EDC8084